MTDPELVRRALALPQTDQPALAPPAPPALPLSRRHLLGALAAAPLTGLAGLAGCAGGGAPKASSSLDAALALPVLVDNDTRADTGVFFGIFRSSLLTDVIDEVQADLRRRPAAVMWFTRFASGFPESAVLYLSQQGVVPQITWEPWGANGEPVPLADIVSGKWDAYLDAYGVAAAKLDLPFMLRWGHEFNGDWYPWCVSKNNNDPALYVQAYRRVVQRLRAAGAKRVQFVWCFNNESAPQADWNDPRRAYPGDDVVDWVGIDGYNFGSTQSWSRWTSFQDVFSAALARAADVAPAKPVLLAEMGCSESGGDKVQWIQRMMADLAQMPTVRAFTWFDIIKETTWAFSSSDGAWEAAIRGLRQPLVRGNGPALLAVAGRR